MQQETISEVMSSHALRSTKSGTLGLPWSMRRPLPASEDVRLADCWRD